MAVSDGGRTGSWGGGVSGDGGLMVVASGKRKNAITSQLCSYLCF